MPCNQRDPESPADGCIRGSSWVNQGLGQDLANDSGVSAGHLRSADPDLRDQDVIGLHPAGDGTVCVRAAAQGLGTWTALAKEALAKEAL